MKIFKAISILFCLSLCACNTDIKDDAKKTPIGSVLSGETKTTDDYIQRVKEANQKATQSPWQPKTDGRF